MAVLRDTAVVLTIIAAGQAGYIAMMPDAIEEPTFGVAADDVILVAAAGNERPTAAPEYPAALPFAVAATHL